MKNMEQLVKEVTLTVSIEEAGKIFKALGNMPFVEVYELIGKLNEQTNQQLVPQKQEKGDFQVDFEQFLSEQDQYGKRS